MERSRSFLRYQDNKSCLVFAFANHPNRPHPHFFTIRADNWRDNLSLWLPATYELRVKKATHFNGTLLTQQA